MPEEKSHRVISTILKHDRKVTSYKIALLRAINDVVLSFPDLRTFCLDVAVPLRMLAEYWVAYYWGFTDRNQPILQGQVTSRDGQDRSDITFRPALSDFRQQWEQFNGELSNPADGFLVINELRVPRKRALYPEPLFKNYQKALKSISTAIENPICYAGGRNHQWTVFEKPKAYRDLDDRVIAVPGTQPQERCLVITADLWQTFRDMSLWVEALCVHEWCLYTERIKQSQQTVSRGDVYTLLTARPDNRRPLTWEANQIDLLLMEGQHFFCPWTGKQIGEGIPYDLDHLVPLSVYPTNELWNLMPSEPRFNRNTKRDRLPSQNRLQEARPHLEWGYNQYGKSEPLAQALREDIEIRFATLRTRKGVLVAGDIVEVVTDLIDQMAEARNLVRF